METPTKIEAAVIASDVKRSIYEHLPELVQQEVAVFMTARETPASVVSSLNNSIVSRRLNRSNLSVPYKPKSNYTAIMIQSVNWRTGKGDRLGYAWLRKPSTSEVLLVEQYGLECSMLRRDASVSKSVWESGVCVQAGLSPWTAFESTKRTLENVVDCLVKKGWEVFNKKETAPPIQLALVEQEG